MASFNAAPVALAKIHSESSNTIDRRFDLFKVLPSETSQTGHTIQSYQPVNDPSTSTQIQILVPPSADGHTDLKNSFLKIDYKVTKADGGALEATNVIHCYRKTSVQGLFDRGKLWLNNTQVFFNENLAQSAYIRNLLETSVDVKRGRLSAEGWINDDVFCKDNRDLPAATITKRKALISESKTVHNIIRLIDPLSSSDRYIPPGYAIKKVLTRGPDSAFLGSSQADESAKVVVTKVEWVIRRVFASPSIIRAHTRMLVEGNEHNIPITKYRTRSYHIPPGVKSHSIPLQQIASLPLTIIAGITTHDASIGSFESAPHNFHHHDVSSAELTLDGAPIGQRLLTDFPNNNYADAYVSLLQATDNFNTDKSNGISYQDYRNNKTLFTWVTTTDLPNDDWPSYFHLKRSGALLST